MASRHPLDITFDRLPESLPLLPAKDLLLPGGTLPINFWERPYIHLIEDALAARDRLIGVALLPAAYPGTPEAGSPTASTGCAGRITSFEETADGRLHITLTGYCRFNIKEEIPTMRGYRRIQTDWQPYANDMQIDPNPEIKREKLMELLQLYMAFLGIDMDWAGISSTPNFALVTFFSMSLPFNLEEKQAILTAPSLTVRADLMIKHIESRLHKGTGLRDR